MVSDRKSPSELLFKVTLVCHQLLNHRQCHRKPAQGHWYCYQEVVCCYKTMNDPQVPLITLYQPNNFSETAICLSLSNMETHPAPLRRKDNVQPCAHLVS